MSTNPNRLASSRSSSGRVIFQDDFQAGTTPSWKPSTDGTGSIAIHTAHKFEGNQCLGITTDAINGHMSEALKILPIPVNKRGIGLEFYFSMPTTYAPYITFGLEYQDRTLNVRDACWIECYPSDFPPLYCNQSGSNVQITGAGFPTIFETSNDYEDWHYAKLVADFLNRVYVSLQVDDVTYKFPAGTRLYDYSGTPARYDALEAFFMFNNMSANSVTGLIADAIVTDSEP